MLGCWDVEEREGDEEDEDEGEDGDLVIGIGRDGDGIRAAELDGMMMLDSGCDCGWWCLDVRSEETMENSGQ